jgi:hypothetical protein
VPAARGDTAWAASISAVALLPCCRTRTDHTHVPLAPVEGRGTDGRAPPMIKYVYEIDYPPGGKDKYLQWVRSIADALQAPGELRRLTSYDNVYSLTPHRVVEFTFDSPEDAARYFDRKEIGLILKGELPAHSANIHIKVLALRDDYSKDTTARTAPAQQDQF